MVEVYVVRHGVTESNKENIVIGHEDSPLEECGQVQIKNMIAGIVHLKFDCLYSSDLGRAQATAKIIARQLKHPVKIVPTAELREINYGKLSGMDKLQAQKQYPQYHQNVAFVNPGGESFQQLYDRVIKYFTTLIKQHSSILLVTHAGCMRALYSFGKGEDFEKNLNLKLGHDALLKIEINGQKKKTSLTTT